MDEEFPLRDAADVLILMLREAHFAGQFDQMLDYYAQEGKGVHADVEISRIHELIEIERELKQNLGPLFLQGSDAEKVARARQMYKELRDLYEKPAGIPRLIADLILTEDPEAETEIEALVKEKSNAVPALIQLTQSEDLHDPVFPGYGMAPSLAIQCLGKIGDKRAIISLFESMGTGDFFDDNLVLDALKAMGEPAKAFLLKVLQAKPLTEDNEKAAIALVTFKEDPEVAATALQLLTDPKVRQDAILSTYLALICEGLKNERERSDFQKLIQDPLTSKTLRLDMESITKQWK